MKLSICIPTYNRAVYLNEALSSIFEQVSGSEFASQLEICISDNASTDGTPEMVKSWQERNVIRVVYQRNLTNEGADRNYLKVVSLASGEYCWLFGSDDLFRGGSLVLMLEAIQSNKDIYLVDRVECDLEMRPQRTVHWLDESEPGSLYRLSNSTELITYLNHAQSLGALFSYLSAIVFKRARWNDYPVDSRFIGTAYSHVYALLSFIDDGCDLVYLKEPLVLCRGQNDSFAVDGTIRRYMLDIDGYALLANHFFAHKPSIKHAFLNVLKKERPPLATLVFVRLRTDNATWHKLSSSFKAAEYGATRIWLVSIAKWPLLAVKKLKGYFSTPVVPRLPVDK